MPVYEKARLKEESKSAVQKKDTEQPVSSPNLTGIPDPMKARFENLSGFSFDDVRVHYNSDKPAQLEALAYTQDNQVYIAPGQEKHLGHELGHVVQQKEGRVKANLELQNIKINDDLQLEREATKLGDTVSLSENIVQMMEQKVKALSETKRHITEIAKKESPKKSHASHMKAGERIRASEVDTFEDRSISDSARKSTIMAENRINKEYDEKLSGLQESKEYAILSEEKKGEAVTQL